MTEGIVGDKGFIQLTIPGHNLLLRKSQGRFLKQLVILTIQRREKMAPGMLVSVQLTPILVQFQSPCLGDGVVHSGLLVSFNKIKTIPHNLTETTPPGDPFPDAPRLH